MKISFFALFVFALLFVALSMVVTDPAITGFSTFVSGGDGAGSVEDVCASASISLLSTGGADQMCYDRSGLFFSLENTGSVEVRGLSVAVDFDHPVTFSIYGRIAAGESVHRSLSFGRQSLSGAQSARIVPILESGGELVRCDGAGIAAVIGEC